MRSFLRARAALLASSSSSCSSRFRMPQQFEGSSVRRCAIGAPELTVSLWIRSQLATVCWLAADERTGHILRQAVMSALGVHDRLCVRVYDLIVFDSCGFRAVKSSSEVGTRFGLNAVAFRVCVSRLCSRSVFACDHVPLRAPQIVL